MSEIQQNKQLVAQKAIKYIDDKYNIQTELEK
jgi:hypothetical protein